MVFLYSEGIERMILTRWIYRDVMYRVSHRLAGGKVKSRGSSVQSCSPPQFNNENIHPLKNLLLPDYFSHADLEVHSWKFYWKAHQLKVIALRKYVILMFYQE